MPATSALVQNRGITVSQTFDVIAYIEGRKAEERKAEERNQRCETLRKAGFSVTMVSFKKPVSHKKRS